jgi:hypothetical protein
MHFALKICRGAIAFVAVAAPAIVTQPAFADGAFVTQATKGASFHGSMIASPVAGPSSPSFVPPPRGGAMQPTPETTVSASGGNFAGTLETGRNNFVLQSQSGSGNFSNVGVLGGVRDNVDVLQHGKGLFSDVVLVGVKGLSVDVLQPPGTAPVEMLIGQSPNGTLEIFQPKGAPQATVFRVGNVLVVK